MPRIRSLKPEFFTDSDLGDLSPLHRILFAGLWCQADREGRLEDKPKDLRIRILPFDECNVDAMLSDLERTGRIQRYVADGKRFIWVIRFLDHQRPHKDEKASVIPAPPPLEPRNFGAGTVETPHEPGNFPVNAVPAPTEHRNFGGKTPDPCFLVTGAGSGDGSVAGADAPPLEQAPLFGSQPQTQDNPPAKSKAKRVTTDRPRSRHAAVIKRLADAFESAIGSKYGFNDGKDGESVKWLLGQTDDDAEIERRWRAGLASRDKWLGIRTLAQLRQKWNDLSTVDAPGFEPAGPACAAPGCANEGRSEVPGAGAVCGAHVAAWMDSAECADAPARGFAAMGAAWLERLGAGVAA